MVRKTNRYQRKQARYYCQLCQQYVYNNTAQIRKHESSPKHIRMVNKQKNTAVLKVGSQLKKQAYVEKILQNAAEKADLTLNSEGNFNSQSQRNTYSRKRPQSDTFSYLDSRIEIDLPQVDSQTPSGLLGLHSLNGSTPSSDTNVSGTLNLDDPSIGLLPAPDGTDSFLKAPGLLPTPGVSQSIETISKESSIEPVPFQEILGTNDTKETSIIKAKESNSENKNSHQINQLKNTDEMADLDKPSYFIPQRTDEDVKADLSSENLFGSVVKIVKSPSPSDSKQYEATERVSRSAIDPNKTSIYGFEQDVSSDDEESLDESSSSDQDASEFIFSG